MRLTPMVSDGGAEAHPALAIPVYHQASSAPGCRRGRLLVNSAPVLPLNLQWQGNFVKYLGKASAQ
ncbi:hypothetical protein CZ787_18995 [Halomonas citrativorans]|uniref:Uncharacterized protein n=1 Tax=Halomonas citrativorans TaxID=2742612 RepID=A0A1R4I6A4_9GAMM|nr:hypothetical protein CZ787_18995 [Halomonas citrativorans]